MTPRIRHFTRFCQSTTFDYTSFIHRTFLEYLSAAAAANERDIGALVSKADDEQWREVIVLAAGITDLKGRSELVSGLISYADRHQLDRASAYFLAAACVETAVEIDPEVKSEVLERLKTLVPPKDRHEVTLIASVGELAVPFLSRRSNRNARQAARCINALAKIRGEAALEALVSYASDTRKTVQVQMARAWTAFDRKEYALKVLSGSPELVFQGSTDIAGCEYLGSITKITIEGNRWLLSLDPITHQYDLRELCVCDCENLEDIGAVAGLSRLTTLRVINCPAIQSIQPLREIPGLKVLSLRGCKEVSNLGPLQRLGALEVLDLRGLEWLSDLSFLVDLRKLRRVMIDEQATSEENLDLLRHTLPDGALVLS
jgi:hypothetical protein